MSPVRSEDAVGVVVAGGSSHRFGGDVPKQYLDLAGASVLERSVAALSGHPEIAGVVVVLPRADLGGARERDVRSMAGVVEVASGGASRAESSRNGVRAAAPASLVLVHDAARPLVSREVVDRVLQAARLHGAAIPVIPVADTVKVGVPGEFVEQTLDRNRLGAAQTPQGARSDWLLEALEGALEAGRTPTDEAAALEAAGRQVHLVAGEPANRKITTREDLEEARRRMGYGSSILRVGTGYDVHRFGDGRNLVLGGVEFPGERGLEGHSDADVVLHAAMDACLGAAAMGDIGAWFPPTDPAWQGADSRELASRVAGMLRDEGFELLNLDLTLLAERPRIRDRVDEMRNAVARSLGLSPDRVGLKATTLEGLGALGRGEGIACQAVAMVAAGESRG